MPQTSNESVIRALVTEYLDAATTVSIDEASVIIENVTYKARVGHMQPKEAALHQKLIAEGIISNARTV